MDTLDLTPPQLAVKFMRGATFHPIFYKLNDDYTPVDLTGFSAKAQARLSATTDVLAGWDLNTDNGGLVLEQGTAVVAGKTIQNAWGIRFNVSAADTAAITWTKAVFGVELISPSGNIEHFLQGTLTAASEVVR